uniref:Uncharacterized protein n=1 Tax=Manihot esculenta TaxID=3983 RepID=A0A2C9UK68_MANES
MCIYLLCWQPLTLIPSQIFRIFYYYDFATSSLNFIIGDDQAFETFGHINSFTNLAHLLFCCDHRMPAKLKGKDFRSQFMIYDTECWAVNKEHMYKLSVANMRMLR